MNPGETVLLRLDRIRAIRGGRRVLDELSFEVRSGERFFILGPSGCGKTTILRIIAGLLRPDRGTVAIDGRVVSGSGFFVPPHRRQVGFVFQDGALWPHLTVEKHLYFAKGARSRKEWTERILELTGLAGRRRDFPHMLSGGELQRIALARALAGRPRLLLLDEPLRNLDRNLAQEMRAAIVEILDQVGTTALFVTHDQEEALSMSHRVLLMDAGGLVQIGTPEEVYHRPATPWAAAFFGPVNDFGGRVGDGGAVATPFGPVTAGLPPGTDCRVLFRPSQLSIAAGRQGASGRVTGRAFLGGTTRLSVRLDDKIVTVACAGPAPAPGDTIFIAPNSAPLVFAAAPPPAGPAGSR